ncbi:MAG TPA: hypothetical protein VFI12_11360 [Thermomicrobiales bacterium]|jgi:hypothetical protein|nr:hypothetical protein [Thermomicrobiales bacterium]
MRGTSIIRLVALLSVFGLFGAVANPARADKPEKVVTHDSFDDVFCDIPVHVTVDGWSILHIQDYVIQADNPEVQDDFWIGVIQDHYDVTWTNEAGVTLTNTVRQTVQEDSLVDNGDGTWTYTFTINGMPEFLRVENDHINKDVGRLTQQFVFYFGDLSTQADDELLSATILGITGPHPTAESDFELFCQNVQKVLG